MQFLDSAQQLALVEPALVRHIMILDPRHRDRMLVFGEFLEHRRIGQQGDGQSFPQAPRLGGAQLGRLVVGGQATAIRLDQVAALVLRHHRQEIVPAFGINFGRAIFVEPVEFALAEQEDAAQDDFGDAVGMRLRIGEAQGRAPAAAEHQPFFDTAHFAQPLDVLDQVPGGVGDQSGVRRRLARPALIEQQYVVSRRIELAAMVGAHPRSGSAVEEHRRFRAGRPAPLPVKRMTIADVEHAGLIGFDRRIEGAAFGHRDRPFRNYIPRRRGSHRPATRRDNVRAGGRRRSFPMRRLRARDRGTRLRYRRRH